MSTLPELPIEQENPKLFYGWFLLGITWCLYGLGACPAYYSWPFFTPNIQDDLGLTRAQTGTVFGIFGFIITFVGPLSGACIARWGIRRTMIAGHLLSGCGFWMTSHANSFTACLISFSIIVGAGMGIGSVVPCQAIATEWFQKYRGRAVAVVLSAGGIIGSAVTWFDSLILEHYSYRQGWQFFVILELLLVLISLAFVCNSPADINQFPDGKKPDPKPNLQHSTSKKIDWSFSTTIKTPQFAMLLLCNVAFLVPWSVTVGHGRLHLEDSGLTIHAAAGVLSVMVFMSVTGRLCGGLGDVVKPEKLLACSLVIEGLGVLGFLFASNTLLAYASSIAIALGFGASYISLSVVTANFYGKDRFAKTIGLIYLGAGFFNAPAAGIAGKLYDTLGSYTLPFAAIATFSIAIGLNALRLRPPVDIDQKEPN